MVCADISVSSCWKQVLHLFGVHEAQGWLCHAKVRDWSSVSVSPRSLPEVPYRPHWSQDCGCGNTEHIGVYKEQQRKDA